MRNYKIVIVGAGPAGYFTAQAFQNAQTDDLTFAIDMIERLPTPWGLVRSGVAPDHPKIKTVSKVFEKIAKEPNFRLFANVELGKDVSLKDLRDQYDVVVLATGASKGRKLGIPGEELKNSLSAAEFVPWYNAHPDYVDVEVDLTSDTAVVIGGILPTYKVAIVGAGPAGYFTAQAFQNAQTDTLTFTIDVIEMF